MPVVYWTGYAGVFEHMAGMYDIPVHGAYNPPGYAQPQYDQYYQQYPFQPPQYPPQRSSSSNSQEMMMSSVEMTRLSRVKVRMQLQVSSIATITAVYM
ncbi:hypothetical protein Tco_1191807 [Tanacetum coccineum]